MEYAIVLYFNEKISSDINKIIKLIAKETNNDYMIAHNIPPHITIAYCNNDYYTEAARAFYTIADGIESGDVKIVSIGTFSHDVVFLAPIVNEYLLNCCIKANDILTNTSSVINEYYTPYNWVPHISIATKLNKSDSLSAFRIAQESFIPFQTNIEKIALVKCNPYVELMQVSC